MIKNNLGFPRFGVPGGVVAAIVVYWDPVTQSKDFARNLDHVDW